MKTNGDEKETHLAETTATYALGVFCQLVNPYISGVDHHKKGFMKDFFDAVLEDDGLRNPLPQHHRNRKPGKTTITTGVWSHQQRQIAPWALFGPLEGLSNSTG